MRSYHEKKTMTFVKFMSREHLNGMNISLYEGPHNALLRAEHVVSNKQIGRRFFESADLAKEWYDALPGRGLGRLDNALEIMNGVHE